MTLFDRRVDLARFSEATPLYVMCREWMRNNPHRRQSQSSPGDGEIVGGLLSLSLLSHFTHTHTTHPHNTHIYTHHYLYTRQLMAQKIKTYFGNHFHQNYTHTHTTHTPSPASQLHNLPAEVRVQTSQLPSLHMILLRAWTRSWQSRFGKLV